ncbi:MAG: phospholipid carrier-dependent glycosyltransferase [Cyanophyceae cyanobacterium]
MAGNPCYTRWAKGSVGHKLDRYELDKSELDKDKLPERETPGGAVTLWRSPARWKLTLGLIFALSLAMRFWKIGQFNTLVFDEVYFAKFADNYLTQTPFFDAHPPLSKYIIAVGIWIGSHIPIGRDTMNDAVGTLRTTFSYRWLNGLVGSFIPLVLWAIAWELSRSWRLATIAAALLAMDGLFLVESRYGLNNIYLVLFGLLGQYCFLKVLATFNPQQDLGRSRQKKRRAWFTLAGLFLGATVSIKWNGAGFWFVPWSFWLTAKLYHWWTHRKSPPKPTPQTEQWRSPLNFLAQISVVSMGLYLVLVPAVLYCWLWIPHLLLNPDRNLWDVNLAILNVHQNVGGNDIHPYCSPWYSWPLLLRPLAYFYARVADPNSPLDYDNLKPDIPDGVSPVIFDVHAMGNPILWWLSVLALAIAAAGLAQYLWQRRPLNPVRLSNSSWFLLFTLGNYSGNLLLWLRVTRCTFLYHYMGALTFAILTLAWMVNRCLDHRDSYWRWWGVFALGAIATGFIFWLPVYLGLPLSQTGWSMRVWNFGRPWLPNWI